MNIPATRMLRVFRCYSVFVQGKSPASPCFTAPTVRRHSATTSEPVGSPGPGASMQHVARHARPPVPGEARAIGLRSSDGHPDDARSERTEEIDPFHRRRGGGGRVPIRSGLPARLQEPHGCDSGAVAKNAGAVQSERLREACSTRRCEAGEDTGSGSSCQTQASEGRRCASLA